MNYYTRHIFFCSNVRSDGKDCCSQFGGKEMYRYAKNQCRNIGKLGKGKIGVSESRCLGRCENGPVAVVYPDNVWYQYTNKDDIDEIISQHLLADTPVKHLQID